MRPPTPGHAPRHDVARSHPGLERYFQQRAASWQARLADAVTTFAGSMLFVWLHALVFAVWMLVLERSPWPSLTLVVSLEAIFLSAFVLIGQNRQAEVQRAKADHDFVEQELELKSNTELTRQIHELTRDLHRRMLGDGGQTDSPER
ncbi:MAG: DUF1003 domain-containing protein [Nocardioides sp.]|nr:DUF1003 domain-containing protein [Nocardioides sp.]